ncbi:MCP four helix bundle domain-containing protein [Haliscomenobacter sp.]|uniref:MCP four helix bundle domain-containing protein n=1 Tax=Haliscomenobacter sp. TaxID=2717303 RepID=UPI003BAAEB02
MKWTYGIRQKAAASVLLAVVLGLVMLNNLVERNQIRRLDKSFSSMYEDRLLAESYLFQLYDQLQQKNELFQASLQAKHPDIQQFDIDQHQKKLNAIIDKFEKTQLTKEEADKYQRFKTILADMSAIDAQVMDQTEQHSEIQSNLIERSEASTTKAFAVLAELSEIQTTEGQVLRSQSKRIMLGNLSASYFEMAILVIIALLIQGLVLSTKTLQLPKTQGSNLN